MSTRQDAGQREPQLAFLAEKNRGQRLQDRREIGVHVFFVSFRRSLSAVWCVKSLARAGRIPDHTDCSVSGGDRVDRITREYHQAMAHATDYQTWLGAAEELDLRDGLEEWKDDEISEDYDWRLIRSRLRQIRQYRAAKDIRRIVYHLRQGLHWT